MKMDLTNRAYSVIDEAYFMNRVNEQTKCGVVTLNKLNKLEEEEEAKEAKRLERVCGSPSLRVCRVLGC